MPTVHVILRDAAADAVMGEVDLPVEQLPESFAAPTTLHLAGADWHVERAEPPTRAAFAASGRLALTLRRVVQIDPKTILFSLPTLESTAPPTSGASDNAVWMHEDDWRQIELVASRLEADIALELEAIRSIFTHQRKGVGFLNLHVRARIPEPLTGVALRVADLGLAGPRRELAIGSASGPGARVVGGFAFAVGDGAVYGREVDGRVVALGLTRGTDPAPLVDVARSRDLVLVDWCSARAGRLEA